MESNHHLNSGIDNPLSEVRALIVINQQLVRSIQDELKETSIETRLALQKIGTIEGSLLVIVSRLDRMDKDADEAKQERVVQKQLTHSHSWVVWSALLTAIFAAVIPLIIHPGVVSSPSTGHVNQR